MITQLRTLLWKEWRDHRAALIALFVAVPVLLALGLWAFGDRLIQDHPAKEPTVILFPFVALLIVIAVGSELFAGESRRETLGFLLRVPSGLGKPLAVKVVFYVLSLAGMLGWAFLLLLGMHALFGHSGVFFEALWSNGSHWQEWTTVACLGGLWVMLVSCWVPRGGGAALGGVLMLGLLVLPLWLLHELEPHFLSVPGHVERFVGSFAWWGAATALLALVLSFAIGRRYGRGVWSSAWRGLSVVALLMAGTTVWGLDEVGEIRSLTPHDDGFHIVLARPLAGERWVLAHVQKYQYPPRVWAIDTANGSFHEVASSGGSLSWGHADWIPAAFSSTALRRPPRLGRVITSHEVDGESVTVYHWVDAATGDIVKSMPSDTPHPEIDATYEADLREWTRVRHSDGRRAWLCRVPSDHQLGRLGYAVEQPDGTVRRHAMPNHARMILMETQWGWVAAPGFSSSTVVTVAPFEPQPVRLTRTRHPNGQPVALSLWRGVVAAPTPHRLLAYHRRLLHWIPMDTGVMDPHLIPGVINLGSPRGRDDGIRRLHGQREDRERVFVLVDPDSAEHTIVPYERGVHGILLSQLEDGRWLSLWKNRVAIENLDTGERKLVTEDTSIYPVGMPRDGRVLALRNFRELVWFRYETGTVDPIWPAVH